MPSRHGNGKHHEQAICACATHLLDRVLVVLRDDRPDELRDVDGTAVTTAEARALIAERYRAADEVRTRNNERARREQRADEIHVRPSRSSWHEASLRLPQT